MNKLVVSVLALIWFPLTAYSPEDAAYSREPSDGSDILNLNVPSDYPTIQEAIDAAAGNGGMDLTITVEEGIYRESVRVTGIRNLKLIGRKARILPPEDFLFSGLPDGDYFPSPSFSIVNCENFRVDGFTFIGDDFTLSNAHSYPMGTAVLAYNSSGTITNNIIFNFINGISFRSDNARWMKGEISDNYIHNCLWSGIFATGSHCLKIHNNKIAFTVPKELSISVGIWTDGGMGIISGNHITSYRRVDYHSRQQKQTRLEFWPLDFPMAGHMGYQMMDNIFEQTAAGTHFTQSGGPVAEPYGLQGEASNLNSYYINVVHHNLTPSFPEIVMLPSR